MSTTPNPDQQLATWLDEYAAAVDKAIRAGNYRPLTEAHPAFKMWYSEHHHPRGPRLSWQVFRALYPPAWKQCGMIRDVVLHEAGTAATPPAAPSADPTGYGNVRTPDDHRIFLENRRRVLPLLEELKAARLAALSLDELEGLIDRINAVIIARRDLDSQLGAMSAEELKQAVDQVTTELQRRRQIANAQAKDGQA